MGCDWTYFGGMRGLAGQQTAEGQSGGSDRVRLLAADPRPLGASFFEKTTVATLDQARRRDLRGPPANFEPKPWGPRGLPPTRASPPKSPFRSATRAISNPKTAAMELAAPNLRRTPRIPRW